MASGTSATTTTTTTTTTASYVPGWDGIFHQTLASMVVGFAAFAITQAVGFTSPGLPSMERDPSFNITTEEGSWASAALPGMALFGSVAGGLLLEAIGRRGTMLLTVVPFLVSWAALAVAWSAMVVIASRALAGLCTGAMVVTMTLYVAECVHQDYRAKVGVATGVVGNAGLLLAYMAGRHLEWRALAWLGFVTTLPTLFLTLMLPESPLFCMRKGRKSEAKAGLEWLLMSPYAAVQYRELEEHGRRSKSNMVSLTELLSPPYWLSLKVSLLLMLAQQFSGIQSVTSYAGSIFEETGSSVDSGLCAVIMALLNTLTSVSNGFIMHRINRRFVLKLSTIVVVLTEVGLGVFFWARMQKGEIKEVTDSFSFIAVLGIFLFMLAFGSGLGPIGWMFPGEGLPSRSRGPAAAIALMTNWACSFVVTKSFHNLVSFGYHYAFFSYALMTGVMFLWLYPIMPETRGRFIIDMDRYYGCTDPKTD